jgi:hypothetical protein
MGDCSMQGKLDVCVGAEGHDLESKSTSYLVQGLEIVRVTYLIDFLNVAPELFFLYMLSIIRFLTEFNKPWMTS